MTQIYFRQIPSFKISSKLKQFFIWLFKNSFKFGMIILFSVFIMKNELSFQLNLNSVENQILPSKISEEFSIISPFSNLFERGKETDEIEKQTKPIASSEVNLSNDYSNMTYRKKAKNTSDFSAPSTTKIKKQQNYVKRFAEVARSEMRKFGIPASITLAQGLIESNAGYSRLSKENNNHFGMKCFSKKCKKGHCANFTDDSHKDFFRKYETAWESYRAHSIMLGGSRYKHLKKLAKSDYKGWAHGLKKAGYATDKRYAEKLIHIIEEMDLFQFDK